MVWERAIETGRMRARGRGEGLLSRESGSLGAAFSATLPSSSNDRTLCQKGWNVCKNRGSKGIHLENY